MSQLLRETLQTIRSAGFNPHVEQNRHFKISFINAQGRKCVVILSCTPGSRFALRRNRSLLRRLLKDRTNTTRENS
jgi:hypothetical protein